MSYVSSLKKPNQSHSRRHGVLKPKRRYKRISRVFTESNCIPDRVRIGDYLKPSDFKSVDTASPIVMQERMEYQTGRLRELREEGRLTPEWKRFGRKIESEF